MQDVTARHPLFDHEQANLSLAKTLAPPGAVNLSLKYRQGVTGFYEAKGE